MAGDELDELYGVAPEEFTALRNRLAAAARKRGDSASANAIAAARKPTTAAWVVNMLTHSNDDVTPALTELGERLRTAHAAMDGAAIRALSGEQRRLVDEFARSAFDAAGMSNPSASVREDVMGTLSAAIADPDVAARLGRLVKAERWSGFGDFGATTAVSTVSRSDRTASAPAHSATTQEAPAEGKAEEQAKAQAEVQAEVQAAAAAVAAAERAKDKADSELSDRLTDRAVARLRVDEMRQRLEEAERNLAAAEEACREATQVGRAAVVAVREAKERLRQAKRVR
ncbi:hypothetical protein DVS77_06870 [Mycolicibacterium moriokaense]|nr:hypothetical protein DVS77_06870 [Mycolicibacterium moriokaense]